MKLKENLFKLVLIWIGVLFLSPAFAAKNIGAGFSEFIGYNNFQKPMPIQIRITTAKNLNRPSAKQATTKLITFSRKMGQSAII